LLSLPGENTRERTGHALRTGTTWDFSSASDDGRLVCQDGGRRQNDGLFI